jgi:YafQ family addiction module toxin component
MAYEVKFSKQFERSMKKMKKKNPQLFKQIQKKLMTIVKNPSHYKPLKHELSGYRRVHFGSFVLIYTIRNEVIKVVSIDHHDKSY